MASGFHPALNSIRLDSIVRAESKSFTLMGNGIVK